jgi:tRNA threonylcarbamoyl adenosine modification protein YeaZ
LILAAFDTSSDLGSVAVGVGGEVVARAFLTERRRQAAELIPALEAAVAQAGLAAADLEGIVVGSGPGSFTGVRIAAATARGLGAALRIPVWPRSSLLAAAASLGAQLPEGLPPGFGGGAGARPLELSAEAEGWARFVLFDARADRLYGGCWRLLPDRIEELVAPAALTLNAFLDLDLPARLHLCGSGAHRHAEVLEAHEHRILPPPAGLPLAEGLLRVHALDAERAPEPPDSRWEPAYLRPSQPEREAAERP